MGGRVGGLMDGLLDEKMNVWASGMGEDRWVVAWMNV